MNNGQQAVRMSYTGILRGYLLPEWRRAGLLLALLLLGAGLTLASPGILAAFIDAVLGVKGDTLRLGGLFLAVALANQLVTIATTYLSTDIGLRATNRLRTDLTLHCLGLDMAFHNRTTPGTLIERIDGDVTRLNQFLSNFAMQLIRNGLLLVGSIVAIALVDWRAGAVVSGFVLVMLVFLEYSRRAALPTIKREREASAQLFGLIEERLAGVEDMRANGATPYVMRRFDSQSQHWAWRMIRSHWIGAIPGHVSHVIYALGVALVLALDVWLVTSGAITIGVAYAIYRYVELLRWPIQQIGRQVQDMQQAGAAIIRLEELFNQHSMIRDKGSRQLETTSGVWFKHVSFAYPTTEAQTEPPRYALHDLSFQLPAGATLGLLGRTGSGKTTISRLLLRFYEPTDGTITLGDTPIDQFSLAALRNQVGLVTQEVQLFHASVRDNLSLFDPNIADERLHDAIRAVEMDTWLGSLSEGLDTVLPPGGGLSAGQAQLFAVARVLLRDPALIILDEASSRLDPATEARLEHAFARLLHDRTSIVIAHRLATVQRADYIMVLENGHCVEFGPRAQLATDRDSHFARLLHVGMEEALA